jgi:hypothetical protein
MAASFDETLDRPERLVMRAIGFSRAELVVEYDRPFLAQYAQRFQVIVGETGAAVNRDERYRVAVADDFVPDLAAGDIDVALFHRTSERKLRVVFRVTRGGRSRRN